MAKNKLMMSVTASAAIAAAILGAEETSAATHKVERGETLWSIAQKHGTSVSNLQTLNNLSSNTIYANQVIRTVATNSPNVSEATTPSQATSSTSTSSAHTYTVKAGDSLSSIASRHGISLQNLMSWNNLDTTLIFPGNVFHVQKPGNQTNTASSTPANSSGSSSTATTSVYTVKSGDTLSRIANQYGVSVTHLKSWNNLQSNTILIGQKLNLTGSAASNSVSKTNDAPATHVDFNATELINTAKSVIGTPYVWGGTQTSGFDCSGFIHYAYNQVGKNISRLSTDGYFDRSYYVSKPQVGDLVFFSGTYRSGISHMGIYLGNNQFIHAGTSTGVAIASLSNSYWSKHFDSFKRFY